MLTIPPELLRIPDHQRSTFLFDSKPKKPCAGEWGWVSGRSPRLLFHFVRVVTRAIKATLRGEGSVLYLSNNNTLSETAAIVGEWNGRREEEAEVVVRKEPAATSQVKNPRRASTPDVGIREPLNFAKEFYVTTSLGLFASSSSAFRVPIASISSSFRK